VDWPAWAKAPGDLAGLWREWRQGRVALLGDHRVEGYVELVEEDGRKANLRRWQAAATEEVRNGI
jgi:hypothetical protein